jgi:hypothetical protein
LWFKRLKLQYNEALSKLCFRNQLAALLCGVQGLIPMLHPDNAALVFAVEVRASEFCRWQPPNLFSAFPLRTPQITAVNPAESAQTRTQIFPNQPSFAQIPQNPANITLNSPEFAQPYM